MSKAPKKPTFNRQRRASLNRNQVNVRARARAVGRKTYVQKPNNGWDGIRERMANPSSLGTFRQQTEGLPTTGGLLNERAPVRTRARVAWTSSNSLLPNVAGVPLSRPEPHTSAQKVRKRTTHITPTSFIG